MDAGAIGTWIGVGVAVVGVAVSLIALKNAKNTQKSQTQTVTGGSMNIQSGRDTNINSAKDKNTAGDD